MLQRASPHHHQLHILDSDTTNKTALLSSSASSPPQQQQQQQHDTVFPSDASSSTSTACLPPIPPPSPVRHPPASEDGDFSSSATSASSLLSFCSSSAADDPPVQSFPHLSFSVSGQPLQFRSLGRDDLLPLKQLQEQLFPVRYSDEFYCSLLHPRVLSILAFRRSEDAEQQQQLVGIALANHRTQRTACTAARHTAYLITLGSHPSCRQLGLGSFLLSSMSSLLYHCDCDSISLHVLASNDAAVRLYIRHGWSVQERLEGHYLIDGLTHAALLMARQLDEQHDAQAWQDGGPSRKAADPAPAADTLTTHPLLLKSPVHLLWRCSVQ